MGVETGKNIGDLLNAKHVTWGWFQGGFAPTSATAGPVISGYNGDPTHTTMNGTITVGGPAIY